MTDSEDDDIKGECQTTTPPRRHRDSLSLYSNSKKHPESPDPCSNEPSNMNSSPEAMARQAADAETPKSSIMTKVLGKWSVFSLGLAMSIGVFAFYMGASRPDPELMPSYGDPSCW